MVFCWLLILVNYWVIDKWSGNDVNAIEVYLNDIDAYVNNSNIIDMSLNYWIIECWNMIPIPKYHWTTPITGKSSNHLSCADRWRGWHVWRYVWCDGITIDDVLFSCDWHRRHGLRTLDDAGTWRQSAARFYPTVRANTGGVARISLCGAPLTTVPAKNPIWIPARLAPFRRYFGSSYRRRKLIWNVITIDTIEQVMAGEIVMGTIGRLGTRPARALLRGYCGNPRRWWRTLSPDGHVPDKHGSLLKSYWKINGSPRDDGQKGGMFSAAGIL